MSNYVFEPPPIPAVAIAGEPRQFPVHRIFCVGRNYAAHAIEMGADPNKEPPCYFTKSARSLVPSGATIPYPPATSNYHHEVEFVVALEHSGFEVSRDDALTLVYGYAVGLDMTRRDLQQAAKKKSHPWALSKDFKNAAVISPIVPATSCGHLREGTIELKVNGALRQASNLNHMIWDVPDIIYHLSRFYRLMPGDLIYSGTPAGVGAVSAGDVLEGGIEGLGRIALTIAETSK